MGNVQQRNLRGSRFCPGEEMCPKTRMHKQVQNSKQNVPGHWCTWLLEPEQSNSLHLLHCWAYCWVSVVPQHMGFQAAARRQHANCWLQRELLQARSPRDRLELRTPNSGSLASTAHGSVMFCKGLRFLAHSFLSLSCCCLVHEHNWPCKIIQKTEGTGPKKTGWTWGWLSAPISKYRLKVGNLSTKEII